MAQIPAIFDALHRQRYLALPTGARRSDAIRFFALAEAADDPLVKAIMDMFPGSTVKVTLKEEQIPDAAYEDAFSEEREDE